MNKKIGGVVCFYIWDDAAAGVAGCDSRGLMVKKAIASNNAEIHIRINPMPKAMINTAPMSNSNPEVENKPTPVFAESDTTERLMKKAAMIENTQRITKTARSPARKGKMAVGFILDVSGVKPESADQSPFQVG